MNLNTEIEKKASKACELPAFKSLKLIELKSNVADILSLIGKSDMFSTYTKHDISHIEAMLTMCEWLIPPSTKKEMTPVDWLLITLSIYLHDLGMVTTYDEFEDRNTNPLYTSFRKEIEENPKLAEYKHRAPKGNFELKEKFFFQEFIRKQHGNRIKDWISGKINNYPTCSINKLIEIISKDLEGLPIRFINHLSNVCASHQFDDIENIDKYPIFQSYGSNPEEIANVQYAALILRTTDLLHVTKDRTPSVMYQIINISDPLGIDEWDKQLGTFSVRHQARKFNESDTINHKIVISADFKEERPFFSMSEYIIWANNEINNCKRWADKSREKKDAADYFFPWTEIIPDIRVENNEPNTLKFELDRGKLLDLLVGHTIYNDPTVVVRELLQNAIDAVRFYRYKEQESNYNGVVNVYWRNKERELVVVDNGIGMSQEIIKNNLMKVGASYYNSVDFSSENPDFSPISRFGIGILTCFMVSDDIEIITCQNNKGHRIKMTSVESNYLLKELVRNDEKLKDIEPHGTKVIIKFRESIDLKNKTIEQILKHWVISPSCPVNYFEDDNKMKVIGFKDTEAILRYFTPEINSIENEDEDEDDYMNKLISYEIVTKKFSLKSSKAELSFLVGKRYTPERKFINEIDNNENNLPIICVEGIRVDNMFPGFDNNIIGVLAIEGTKDFKTTVSRNGLEKDGSYDELAKALSSCFIDYIDEEINRVAKSHGNPLSQASTVGLWIYQSLIEELNIDFEKKIVQPMFNKVPQLVFETIRESKTIRKLINEEDLQNVESFWTIESRLADSLGIISRDLGKELSVNEFFILLSIDDKNSVLSPIIYDAHLFSDWIIKSHKVSNVVFSMSKQQTQIEWIKKTPEEVDTFKMKLDLFNDKNNSILETLISKYKFPFDGGIRNKRYRNRSFLLNRLTFQTSSYDLDLFPYSFMKNSSACVNGDVENIELIKTRLIGIFKDESIISQQWKTLENCLVITLNNKDTINAITCVLALNLLSFSISYSAYDVIDLEHSWSLIIEDLEKVFELHNISSPSKKLYKEFFENKKLHFDASRFWFDWYEN